MMKYLTIIIVLMPLLFSPPAWSDGDWYWKSGIEALYKNYSGSQQYENLFGIGAYLTADYLEQASFIAGFNHNQRKYKSGLTDAPSNMNQNIIYLGGRWNFYPDTVPGTLTLRLDGYVGKDVYDSFTVTIPGGPMGGTTTQTVSATDDFSVLNPAIAFLNYNKTFYLDLGYAHSRYHSADSTTYDISITHPGSKPGSSTTVNASEDITVTQWTPTIGFGFNHAADWVQLRAYLISYSSSNRVAYKDSTSALEAKWTHWFSSNTFLGMHSTGLNVLVGERIYAVDSDTYSLYNVADLQKGSLAVDAEWRFGERSSLLAEAGYEKYEDIVLDDRYNSTYIYLQWLLKW